MIITREIEIDCGDYCEYVNAQFDVDFRYEDGSVVIDSIKSENEIYHLSVDKLDLDDIMEEIQVRCSEVDWLTTQKYIHNPLF